MADETPGTPPTPDVPRPKPEYGEYAPEGWSWKPEGQEEAATAHTGAAAAGERAARPAGVPHNLGVSPDASGAGTAPNSYPPTSSGGNTPPAAPGQQTPTGQYGQPPSQPGQPTQSRAPGAPYRASDAPTGLSQPQQPGVQPQPQPAPVPGVAPQGAPQGPARLGDRIVTIVLLVLGAWGALSFAQSMFTLPTTLNIMAAALEVENFTVPESVATLGTVGGIIVLALYAVTLIFSIQRIRKRKITFWAPLTAGIIAMILTLVFMTIAVTQAPELLERASDPDATAKMLEYVSSMSTTP